MEPDTNFFTMNESKLNSIRESICATCLSQDRKLYPARDSDHFATVFHDLFLSENEKLCWECRHIVLKMAVFRSRALRAQAMLADFLDGKHPDIKSLSCLSSSKPIIDTCRSDGDVETEVDLELVKKEVIDTPSSDVPVKCEENSGDEMGDEDINDEEVVEREVEFSRLFIFELWLSTSGSDADRKRQVLQQLINTVPDDENVDTRNLDKVINYICKQLVVLWRSSNRTKSTVLNKYSKWLNETECVKLTTKSGLMKDMLCCISDQLSSSRTEAAAGLPKKDFGASTSKSTTPIIMPTLYVQKEPKLNAVEDKSSNFTPSKTMTIQEIPISYVPEAPKEKDILEVFNPDFTYSDVMTKEEILVWRKRKEKMEFYTSSALKCEKCIEPFENLTFYKNHRKRHTQMYGELTCDICEMRVGDDAALAYHMKSQHRLLKCNYCSHEWDSPNAMRRHCGEAHAVPVALWTCDQCDHEFGSWQTLSMHARRHRVLKCLECGQLLRSSLERHMLSQHADLPSRRCDVCNAECKGDSGLKLHMKKHVKVDDTTYCAECDSHFKSKYLYRSHLRQTHKHGASDDSRLMYKCAECGKRFLNKYSLTLHTDAVHDKRDKYPCERCGEAFHTVQRRNQHVRREHEGLAPLKNKICDYCGKAFTSKGFLTEHINSHTGARPHRCGLCGAGFGFKSALYMHGRLVHKIKKKTKPAS